MRNVILLVFCLIFLTNAYSQRGVEVGGHVGMATYFGDLNTNYNLSKPGISFGLKSRRNFNERLSIAAGLTYGKVKASDETATNSFERNRNLSFSSNVFDIDFTAEFNFFPYIHGSNDNYYTPYLFAGFSVFKFNPKAELNGDTYVLRDFGTEGQSSGQEYGLVSAALVYGLGFKWDYNRDWSFNVHLSGRKLRTDYIDDVSLKYPDFTSLELSRGAIAVALSNRSTDPDFDVETLQRGNGKDNDVIYYLSIGIMKYFGTLPCPAISKGLY